MRVLVLGSAAGGGVPQWNCRCPVCSLAWAGDARVRPRTQTSVAVSADGAAWVVLDAAPDLRQQIIANPALHPQRSGRHSPIAGVVLSSGEVDHIAGLLCLRESQPFTLLATAATLAELESSPTFGVLRPGVVERLALRPDMPAVLAGLAITAFTVPGKVPLYREGEQVTIGAETEEVIGLEISANGRRLCYVPGLAQASPALVARLETADLLLLEGTTFTDDEMPALGLSAKTARRMGHLPIGGPDGSLAAFARCAPRRRVYIHLNNTNPVLIEDSPERAQVRNAGWEVAHDGMEMVL